MTNAIEDVQKKEFLHSFGESVNQKGSYINFLTGSRNAKLLHYCWVHSVVDLLTNHQ